MTVHLVVKQNVVLVRLPSPTGEVILVDYEVPIRSGESWRGITYKALRNLGSGQHEINL